MKKKLLFVTTTALLVATSSFAQFKAGKISGQVTAEQKALQSATVSVLKLKDSSLVKMGVTDKAGHYEIENLAEGKYLVAISSVNYTKFYSEPFELSSSKPGFELPALTLSGNGKELKGVTVTVKKPFVEQKIDRTIVNVDAVASNTGLTVMDVLEKSPGIMVDKDGNISLKGKQGVMILIDGKPSYLGGQDLANLLKSMPSSQIEQLEIMTNPPAKFDAAGNGGIINLKTKKNKVRGYNGNLTVGAGQGVYPKSSNSLNLNYRSGKWNLFGNYGYNYDKRFQDIRLLRNFRDKNSLNLISSFQQESFSRRVSQFHSYKLGADYYLDKKTTIGVVVNGFINPRDESNFNTTYIITPSGTLDTRNTGVNNVKAQMSNGSVNLNFRRELDTAGTEITADVDYVGYTTSNNQQFDNFFYDRNGVKKQPDELLKSNLPQDIQIFSAKTDFVKQIDKKTSVEAGLKTSFVKTDNNALYQNLVNGSWVTDAGRTNHFIYEENINAAYINGRRELSNKWSAQLGLRLENTVAKGKQVTSGTDFKRNYTQLFPTAYLAFKMDDQNEFVMNYGRRIQRPNYEDLNPFYNFLDKYTYQVGNPYLRPEFTNSLELSHTYGGFLTSTLNYSSTNDIITEIVDQIDSTNTTFVKKSNIASQKNIGISVNLGMPVLKWWRTNIYTNLYRNEYKGIVNGGNITANATSWMINMSNQFTFSQGWGADMSGFFQTGGIQGVLASKAMGSVSFGVSKQVMKKQGTLKLGIRDPFYLQKFHGYSKYQNIDIDFRSARDSRVLNLSFSYRFGKPIKDTRQRKTGGAGDEQNRVKGGS